MDNPHVTALRKIMNMTDGHPINADRRDRIYQICKEALQSDAGKVTTIPHVNTAEDKSKRF